MSMGYASQIDIDFHTRLFFTVLYDRREDLFRGGAQIITFMQYELHGIGKTYYHPNFNRIPIGQSWEFPNKTSVLRVMF